MALIILYMLTVFVGREPVYIAHARGHEQAVAHSLAAAFEEAGRSTGLPPRLLLVVAYSETGFNGSMVGKIGERGVMQMNPRCRAGADYASKCPRQNSACDMWSVHLGAQVLARCLEQCGTYGMAVGCYKSGRCVEGPAARHVLALWRWAESS